jgi:general secretion pathway protein C
MEFLSKVGIPQGGSAGTTAARAVALAPTVVTVVLVIALAAQLAAVVWRVLVPQQAMAPVAGAASAAPAGPNLAGIVGAHLFGTAAIEATGDAASAPATSLRLTLAGTIAGQDPSRGWAIIGQTAQDAKVYATGANVAGGAKLKEVYADRVILERGGRLEALALPRLAGGSAAPVASLRAAPVQSNLAESVQALSRLDPITVSEFIRPQPVFAGGQQKGYRVYPGRNRAQFASAGLMPGDLVTAVNGSPLSDPNSGLETLRGISAGGAVTLTIERNGTEQQITIDPSAALAEIEAAANQLQADGLQPQSDNDPAEE